MDIDEILDDYAEAYSALDRCVGDDESNNNLEQMKQAKRQLQKKLLEARRDELVRIDPYIDPEFRTLYESELTELQAELNQLEEK